MNKRAILKFPLGLPVLALAACQKADDRPNIIFFLVDDFGCLDTQVPFPDELPDASPTEG